MPRTPPHGNDITSFTTKQLEVLLAISKSKDLADTRSIADSLGLPIEMVYARLEHLRRHGFVVSTKAPDSKQTFWEIALEEFDFSRPPPKRRRRGKTKDSSK